MFTVTLFTILVCGYIFKSIFFYIISRKTEQCQPLFLCPCIIFAVASIHSCYWLEQIIRLLAHTAVVVVVVDFILPRVDFHELY